MLRHQVEVNTQNVLRLQRKVFALYQIVASLNARHKAHQQITKLLWRRLQKLEQDSNQG